MTSLRIVPTPPQPLLRPAEAAELLSIAPRTLARLTKDGAIPCIRLGRAVRYRPADVQHLINKHRVYSND